MIIEFDIKSRPRVLQLVLTNYGNRPAFNVSVIWTTKLIQSDNSIFNFSTDQNNQIPVVNKGEKLNYFIDSTVDFYQKNQELTYHGTIKFSLSKNGKNFKNENFSISLVGYKQTMLYDTELSETLKEMRKIPSVLNDIKREIQSKKDQQ